MVPVDQRGWRKTKIINLAKGVVVAGFQVTVVTKLASFEDQIVTIYSIKSSLGMVDCLEFILEYFCKRTCLHPCGDHSLCDLSAGRL